MKFKDFNIVISELLIIEHYLYTHFQGKTSGNYKLNLINFIYMILTTNCLTTIKG